MKGLLFYNTELMLHLGNIFVKNPMVEISIKTKERFLELKFSSEPSEETNSANDII